MTNGNGKRDWVAIMAQAMPGIITIVAAFFLVYTKVAVIENEQGHMRLDIIEIKEDVRRMRGANFFDRSGQSSDKSLARNQK